MGLVGFKDTDDIGERIICSPELEDDGASCRFRSSSFAVKYCIRLIYAISPPSLFMSIFDAAATFMSMSCDGLAIAMVRPLAIAIAKKVMLT